MYYAYGKKFQWNTNLQNIIQIISLVLFNQNQKYAGVRAVKTKT